MDINRAILEQFYFSVSAAFMDGLGTAESHIDTIHERTYRNSKRSKNSKKKDTS